MRGATLCVVFAVFIQLVVAHRKHKGAYELHYVLRERYDDVSRYLVPTSGGNNVTVKIGVTLNKIVDLDENRAIITIAGFQTLEWKDINLTWKPKEYGGIDIAHLPNELIWQPDIKLYSSITAGSMKDDDVMALIRYNGEVTLINQVVYKVPCVQDPDRENLYEWKCSFRFGSWTYSGDIINPVSSSETMDLSAYVPDNTYDVISTTSRAKVVYYECCPEPYSDVTFEVRLKRK